MRSLFITLPQRDHPDTMPPYGALAVMTALCEAGHGDVSLYHIDALRPPPEAALDYIATLSPDVLAVSAPVSTAYERCRFFSREAKKLLPDLKVVVGGNMAASAEVLLRRTGVDFCVLGEGEETAVRLLDWIAAKGSLVELKGIRGLAYLQDDRLVVTGYAKPLPSQKIWSVNWDFLDEACVNHSFPRLSDLDPKSQYFHEYFPYAKGELDNLTDEDRERLNKRSAELACSKGCINRCTFCHRFIKGIRTQSADSVLARIEELVNRFDVGALRFFDECFGFNRKWLQRFCEGIREMGLVWKVGGMRVDRVNPSLIGMMKDAGCRTINYGLESGSHDILRVMEKNASPANNLNAIRWTVEAGLATTPQLVLGMPGESNRTIEETADLVADTVTVSPSQNFNRVSMTRAQALPGSPLYEWARAEGLIGTSIDEEEDYLTRFSDIDAADPRVAVNYTSAPTETWLSWSLVISAVINHRYKSKYGSERYYRQLFGTPTRPSLRRLIRTRDFMGIFRAFPKVMYYGRRVLWLWFMSRTLKSKGFRSGMVALWRNLVYSIGPKRRRTGLHEYQSLRKALSGSRDAYQGTEEMVLLRKGC